VAYVTAGLIGDGAQKTTSLGQYELMMCCRSDSEWAVSLLSRLAPYTFETALKPGDTMDIAPAMPPQSTIVALLFVDYRQFKVRDIEAGALLCIGITEPELKMCRAKGADVLLAALKQGGVFPYTDPKRATVVQ
jgi:hypothetical protein